MKTIGLIGGMSWESSAEYYRLINQGVKKRLGKFHSAKSILFSVDFEEVEVLQHAGDWDKLKEMMVQAAVSLEKAGADSLVICTNTMHKLAPAVESRSSLPLLHIADAAAAEAKRLGLETLGLLGTKFTMEEDFYKARLQERHGLRILIPSEVQRETVHRVIYQELCLGQTLTPSKEAFIRIIQDLQDNGAQGVILGCTEIPLLVQQKDVGLPLLDTTALHADYAVSHALNLLQNLG